MLDAVIIGAGLSGLMSALTLQGQGKSYRILEAKSRIGGRMQNGNAKDGTAFDLGAQWISPHQLRVQELVKRFGFTLVKTHVDGKTIYDIGGKLKVTKSKLPPLPVSALLDLALFQNRLTKTLRGFPDENPWTSKFAKKWDSITIEQWLSRRSTLLTDTARRFYRLLAEEGFCCELSEASLLDLFWAISSSGSFDRLMTAEDYWIMEGAYALSDKMADQIGWSNITLNSPVYRITHDGEGVVIHTESGKFEARKVILAIPPAFCGRIHYEPALPSVRDQLTQRLGQASCIKYNIIYPTPFWRDEGKNGMIYSDRQYFTATMNSSPPHGGKGILTVLVGGEKARQLEACTAARREELILEGVAEYLGNSALFPEEIIEKNWSQEPWIRCGYAAHFAPGVLTQFGPALLRPVGSIHWAGTETSTEWRLYMEGALQSGERAANEVIEILNNEREVKI
ncbi:FAD-dependent oxidoreductase [Dyadobacter sp. NIV53]|uniref:flavin monoamine oxidase family protein n=1 Tax=Dyadobacter sp. NIV53 TaxID=2861765 RepID=UPI001C88C88D|nr:FAD-dependent oxidoreductase [Dyadobacter sp. NIV53]